MMFFNIKNKNFHHIWLWHHQIEVCYSVLPLSFPMWICVMFYSSSLVFPYTNMDYVFLILPLNLGNNFQFIPCLSLYQYGFCFSVLPLSFPMWIWPMGNVFLFYPCLFPCEYALCFSVLPLTFPMWIWVMFFSSSLVFPYVNLGNVFLVFPCLSLCDYGWCFSVLPLSFLTYVGVIFSTHSLSFPIWIWVMFSSSSLVFPYINMAFVSLFLPCLSLYKYG